MRFIFGVIVGIAITVGAAYIHDQNVPPISLTDPTARRVVNWNVVSAITSEQIDAASRWLQSMIGR
jgi:hypothetical protein